MGWTLVVVIELVTVLWEVFGAVLATDLSAGTEMLRLNSCGATKALEVFFFLKQHSAIMIREKLVLSEHLIIIITLPIK